MKYFSYSVVILVSMFFLNACYYDKGELLYPQKASNCDTATVISYSAKVVPILTTQCYNCHLGASAGGGIVMGTHATDKATAVNGKLYGSINHASGFSAMPKGTAKMDACQILLIKKWIDAGSPNN
jgi:hypothetical protein